MKEDTREKLSEIYPLNLVPKIFGTVDDLGDIHISGLLSEIEGLGEREAKVIQLRFEEKKTLKLSGEEMNLRAERVRQIEVKALRKLRHPMRVRKYMSITRAEFMEFKKKYDQLVEEHDKLKQAYELSSGKAPDPESLSKMANLVDLLDSPIERLMLSVRAYNCLWRENIRTIRDLVNLSIQDLAKIRGLGAKTAKEIEMVLEREGLKLSQ